MCIYIYIVEKTIAHTCILLLITDYHFQKDYHSISKTLGKEQDDDHDQGGLKRLATHVAMALSRLAPKKEKNDDHDRDCLKKDLLHVRSWSSEKCF